MKEDLEDLKDFIFKIKTPLLRKFRYFYLTLLCSLILIYTPLILFGFEVSRIFVYLFLGLIIFFIFYEVISFNLYSFNFVLNECYRKSETLLKQENETYLENIFNTLLSNDYIKQLLKLDHETQNEIILNDTNQVCEFYNIIYSDFFINLEKLLKKDRTEGCLTNSDLLTFLIYLYNLDFYKKEMKTITELSSLKKNVQDIKHKKHNQQKDEFYLSKKIKILND